MIQTKGTAKVIHSEPVLAQLPGIKHLRVRLYNVLVRDDGTVQFQKTADYSGKRAAHMYDLKKFTFEESLKKNAGKRMDEKWWFLDLVAKEGGERIRTQWSHEGEREAFRRMLFPLPGEEPKNKKPEPRRLLTHSEVRVLKEEVEELNEKGEPALTGPAVDKFRKALQDHRKQKKEMRSLLHRAESVEQAHALAAKSNQDEMPEGQMALLGWEAWNEIRSI